jgi:hypothetical protein
MAFRQRGVRDNRSSRGTIYAEQKPIPQRTFRRFLAEGHRGPYFPHSKHSVAHTDAPQFYGGRSIGRSVHVSPPIVWNRYGLGSLPSEAEQRVADRERKRIRLLVAGVIPKLYGARRSAPNAFLPVLV